MGVALTELCLLRQKQNLPVLGSFWLQAWPFVLITVNKKQQYKGIQRIIPAKVRGTRRTIAKYNRNLFVEGGHFCLNLLKTSFTQED